MTTTASELAAPPAASMTVVSGYSKDSNSELAMVVSRNSGKDLMGIIKELDEYFLNAADAGADVSLALEVSSPAFSYQSKEGTETTKPLFSSFSFVSILFDRSVKKKIYPFDYISLLCARNHEMR